MQGTRLLLDGGKQDRIALPLQAPPAAFPAVASARAIQHEVLGIRQMLRAKRMSGR